MRFSDGRKRRGILGLDITPLVDVIFQLLVFFLLTATYVRNPNIDINLPKASIRQTTSPKKDVTVGVKEDGDLRYENEEISLERLEGVLRAEYAQHKDAVVIIRADEKARHGRVVEVMDLAKRVGFEKLAIAIQARPAELEP